MCGVGLREDVTEVTDVVVNLVALDAVVVLDALQETIGGLSCHRVLTGLGDDGQEKQDEDNACQNNKFTKTAVIESLSD